MIALTIAFALGGFALGSYLTYRYAPPLLRVRGSTAVGLVICALVGAAVGLACMYVYLAIYALGHTPALTSVLDEGHAGASASPDANVFAGALFSIASQSGVLLALAAALHLLASGSAAKAETR